MVLKKLGLFISGLLFVFFCFAQNSAVIKNEKAYAFGAINNIGIIEGNRGVSFQVQTINGLRAKNWFAGLGTGIDHDRYRGIPVFVDVRHKLFQGPVPLHVYADAGIHFPWVKEPDNSWYRSEYSNGFIYDVGLTYTFPLKNNYGIIISGGYSGKDIKEDRFSPTYCINPPCPETKETYDYKLKRLTVKAGLAF